MEFYCSDGANKAFTKHRAKHGKATCGVKKVMTQKIKQALSERFEAVC